MPRSSLIEKLKPYMRDRSPKHYESAVRSGEIKEVEHSLARAVQDYVDQRMPNDEEMGGLSGEQKERFLDGERDKHERDGILSMLPEIDGAMRAIKVTPRPKSAPRKKRRKVRKSVTSRQRAAA